MNKIFMTRSPIEGDIKIKTKMDRIYLKDTESLQKHIVHPRLLHEIFKAFLNSKKTSHFYWSKFKP